MTDATPDEALGRPVEGTSHGVPIGADRQTPPWVQPEEGETARTLITYGSRFVLGYQPGAQSEAFYYAGPRSGHDAAVPAIRAKALNKATRYPLDADGWVSAWSDFAAREPRRAATYLEAAWVERLSTPGRAPLTLPVPLLTLPTLPGQEITEVLGLVTVWSVISRNAISDMGSDLKSVVGGRLGGIDAAIGRAVEESRARMYQQALLLGADAIIGVKVDLQTVSDKAQAVLMSGTAVRSAVAPVSGESSHDATPLPPAGARFTNGGVPSA